MKVFLLKNKLFEFGHTYNQSDAKVVIADNEDQARELANVSVGDEGYIWQDNTKVSCEVVILDTARVLLDSFNAG